MLAIYTRAYASKHPSFNPVLAESCNVDQASTMQGVHCVQSSLKSVYCSNVGTPWYMIPATPNWYLFSSKLSYVDNTGKTKLKIMSYPHCSPDAYNNHLCFAAESVLYSHESPQWTNVWYHVKPTWSHLPRCTT
jgi:hypothetical protein